ncbi:zinc-finger of the MIZ type in Nse subunit-domain-containing protein [Ampelomyces quisqualis]|uniref:Zinc-finger of the MIZ type in Nse subunit-domain-containing protein n=1 Tax=Ampelomyces quisqualis TaxID=50730 RepID=A0A6A5QBA5_AMPQU|nr:zinc-finger of the MIZ type in Nse subunit-domain-containing protein [Ampelomyces quisqualis]
MSHRIRNSNVKPTASRQSFAATPSRNASDELPPYKKPSHPLDSDAVRQLRDLQGRSLDDVKRHNKRATETITATAASINDMLRDHSEYVARRQKKWDAGKNLDDRENEERATRELQEKVNEATAKLEESMRAVIDSGMAAQRIDETLDWVRQHVPKQLEEEYNTQRTQRDTQRQSQSNMQRRRTQNADEDEDMSDAEELDEGPTPGPTPLDGTRISLTGVSEVFTDRQQRQKDAYTSLSRTARYARNNEYRDFKRIVHDAKYGDSGQELGHEDTWFTEMGSPAPGITNTQRGDFDDDDDIVINKETISTRCPITFQQLKEPYTSTKCQHTFERNAIMEMIRTSTNMVGGGGPRGGGTRAVTCPQTGCDKNLTLNDFRIDPILVRKIGRIQNAAAAEAEESSDEEDQAPRGSTSGSSAKLQVPSTQQPPQSSIIEDFGDPSEDESMSQQPPASSIVMDLGEPSESEAEL